ncbi:MAG TPA: glycosyltransferase [Candidatus Bathyarchaeia archaeon]|nr:glycosyltransferase [Candidatus Bathyarchaeia archaeon]
MTQAPRVALFCETYHEINGVALTARQLVAYAKRHSLPLLAIHGGKLPGVHEEGSVRQIELKRSWLSIGIERDLEFDFAFSRYCHRIRKELLAFQPDVIHITSPGELGELGVYLSRQLRIPLVASWHTNFHQFAARRLQKLIGFLPSRLSRPAVAWSQERGLKVLLWFYGFAKVTLAPTPPQVEWLEKALRKPSFLMPRGVDPELFNPNHRTVSDGILRLGFVGRVTPEKGVRLLRRIEQALLESDINEFRIIVVGTGSEVAWLKKRLRHGEFTGVLRGEALAQAYANMDLFVFPSRTDTYGNVVQEAAASGVPAIVINEGGPPHLVVHGETGYITETDAEFVSRVVELAHNPELRNRLGRAARERMAGISWDAAFEKTYAAYRHCLLEKMQAEMAPEKAKMAHANMRR